MLNWEQAVLVFFESVRKETLTQVMSAVTHIGGTKSLIVIIFLLTLVLILTKFYKEAAILVTGMLVGVTVSQSLKHLIDRARPDVVPHLTEFSSPSFPSGHAMNNILLATLLTYLSWRMFKNKRLSFIVGVFAYIWAILVGVSRLYLGVHWPTDVIFGWIFGLLVGGGVIWAAERVEGKLKVKSEE